MIKYIKELGDISHSLPLGESHTVASIITDEGETFSIELGLKDEIVSVLVKKSCDLSDRELQQYTSDHARFCTSSYKDWYAQGRYPFVLLSKDRELAGLIWLGPKKLPAADMQQDQHAKEWDTFAIRTYAPFRGKRLARPFAEVVLAVYKSLFPLRSVWLEADPQNDGALRLYEKVHFKEIGYTGNGRVVMVLQ